MANDLDEVTEHLAGIHRVLDMIAMRAAKDRYEDAPKKAWLGSSCGGIFIHVTQGSPAEAKSMSSLKPFARRHHLRCGAIRLESHRDTNTKAEQRRSHRPILF